MDTSIKTCQCCNSQCACKCHGDGKHHCRYWSGIFAGALVAVGIAVLVTLFMFYLGSARNIFDYSVSSGTGIAYIVAFFIIALIGGSLAASCSQSRCQASGFGMLLGFLSWVIAVLVFASLASTAGFTGKHKLWHLYQMRMASAGEPAARVAQNNMPETQGNQLANQATAQNNSYGQGVGPQVNFARIKQHRTDLLLLLFVISIISALGAVIGGAIGIKRCRKQTITPMPTSNGYNKPVV